ncbi:MAG: biotin--[acetyl-CoA-carboxylase] ligase [Muribaculaceae bacterium]|nr:biotin--[acetyl-CoA-carboxylase] ligase [Muribaculaceae bacterium]
MNSSIEWIDSCESTNTLMKERAEDMPHAHVLAARTQTAGRGQRGNSWEAERYMNLTYSQMLRPTALAASRQFELLMLTSLAILDVLGRHLPESEKLSVKWPNDIYYGDRKLGGILIEGSVSGKDLDYMILGAGINVNQVMFTSDAPNPVSMKQIAGHDFELGSLMEELADSVEEQMAIFEEEPDTEQLHAIYMQSLWRREGLHPYRDAATGEKFMAEIVDVAPNGLLHLRTADGEDRRYEFKSVTAEL